VAQVKKIINVVGLIADLMPGVALTLIGVAMIVGAQTGVLWLY
jgi:hypothetical protein